jgi:segregation and condensation protein A
MYGHGQIMTYQVRLPVFEGPMDLLIHLIDINEIDIYNIPIARITHQYMEYIRKAEAMDLELTSEFTVMACTLLAIKARMLLPKRPAADADAAPEEDPRNILVQKLIEYRLYKEKSLELREKENNRSKIFFRQPDEVRWLKLFPPANPAGHLTADKLRDVFARLMLAAGNRKAVIEYTRDEVTIADRMTYIMEALCDHPEGMSFFALMKAPLNGEMLAATFLALLELMRRGLILTRQKDLFDDIFLYLLESEGGNTHQYSVSQ